MNQILNQMQNLLNLQLTHTNIDTLDIHRYNALITSILSIVSSCIPELEITMNDVQHNLDSNYILIQSINHIDFLNGKLTLFIAFKNESVSYIELSIMY